MGVFESRRGRSHSHFPHVPHGSDSNRGNKQLNGSDGDSLANGRDFDDVKGGDNVVNGDNGNDGSNVIPHTNN
jgi:hypothetical protein